MDYKIESNVKPPPKGKFPFANMKKGDSFIEKDVSRLNTLKVNAYYFSKAKGGKVKFSVRKEGDHYRCFRIK